MNIGIVVPDARLPRGRARPLHQARRRAHLRRGEVGSDDRRGRRDRALRRAARPRVLRQGDRRRHARRPRSAGAADVMDVIEHGAAQQGTFNGNPLVAAAGPRRAHRGADARRVRAPRGARHPARRRVREGDRRARHPRPTPSTSARRAACRTGRSRCATTATSSRPAPTSIAASYPWVVNRGVFMTPGDEEQWTLSVQHTDADIDRYVEAFADVLRRGRGLTSS